MSEIKLIAFDLDGTLTQHKTPLDPVNKAVLDRLREKYVLLMVGAGAAMRIFNQLDGFPIDVIGNYGLQEGRYNAETGEITFENSASALENADVSRLFERFYTVDTENGSTGLGLAIAKSLVERMHGDIYAEYNSGRLKIHIRFGE